MPIKKNSCKRKQSLSLSGLTRLYFAKVMRCEERRDPVTVQHLENYDVVPQEREKEKNIPQDREQEKNIPQDREQEKNTNLIGNHGFKAAENSSL